VDGFLGETHLLKPFRTRRVKRMTRERKKRGRAEGGQKNKSDEEGGISRVCLKEKKERT